MNEWPQRGTMSVLKDLLEKDTTRRSDLEFLRSSSESARGGSQSALTHASPSLFCNMDFLTSRVNVASQGGRDSVVWQTPRSYWSSVKSLHEKQKVLSITSLHLVGQRDLPVIPGFDNWTSPESVAALEGSPIDVLDELTFTSTWWLRNASLSVKSYCTS